MVPIALIGVTLATAGSQVLAAPSSQDQSDASLALDANAGNGSGACSPVDGSASFVEGDEFQVAVCLSNPGDVPLAAYQFRVTYDDRLIIAPEVADSGSGLDDNPDANAGSTTFSSPDLGGGWDCTGGVEAFPEGDDDSTPGNGTGVAYSGGCASVAGPNQLTQGPLSVIRFRALGGGEARLTLTAVSITDDDLNEVGSCAPAVDRQMACDGATITIEGAPVPDVTPGAVITPGTPSVGTPLSETPGVVDTAAAETSIAEGTPPPGSTPSAGGTALTGDDAETATAVTSRTQAALRTRTPSAGTIDEDDGDDDGGGGATTWIIIGVVAAIVLTGGAGAAAYWYRFRRGA
jgi:hypothetical protein